MQWCLGAERVAHTAAPRPGRQAWLQQRVEKERLLVTITSAQQQAFWRPVGQALREFSGSLPQGTALAISGAAYLLPWLVVLVLLAFVVWVGRKLWRRRKQAFAGCIVFARALAARGRLYPPGTRSLTTPWTPSRNAVPWWALYRSRSALLRAL